MPIASESAETLTPDAIQEIAQQIVRRFQPKKVILFGSYAYGQPHEESDLDLLVVMTDAPTWRERRQAIQELNARSSVPLQVHFMSFEEFDETKDVIGGIAYPAHHMGKALYESDCEDHPLITNCQKSRWRRKQALGVG